MKTDDLNILGKIANKLIMISEGWGGGWGLACSSSSIKLWFIVDRNMDFGPPVTTIAQLGNSQLSVRLICIFEYSIVTYSFPPLWSKKRIVSIGNCILFHLLYCEGQHILPRCISMMSPFFFGGECLVCGSNLHAFDDRQLHLAGKQAMGPDLICQYVTYG